MSINKFTCKYFYNWHQCPRRIYGLRLERKIKWVKKMEKDKKFSRWALMELRGEDYQANWIDCIKLDFREYLRGDTSYLTFVKYMLFHILEIRKIKKEYNKKW